MRHGGGHAADRDRLRRRLGIGGLISSTALSLILVPVVYEVIDRLENRIAPRLRRLLTPREAPEAAIEPA
jgi:hydrophobic/amphiphilic exporter-1 (mainly G- bacteria), HAE1 family